MSIDKTKRAKRIFRATLGTGAKVEVHLSDKQKTKRFAQFGNAAPPKREEGLWPVELSPDEFIRRRVVLDLQLFDFGQLLDTENGIYKDIERYIAPSMTWNEIGGNPATQDPLLLSDYTELVNQILEQEDVFNRARKITPATSEACYQIYVERDGDFTLLTDDADFTENGWKLGTEESDATALSLFHPRGTGHHLKLKGPSKIKSTMVQDFAAPEANYIPANGDKIYFVPAFCQLRGFAAIPKLNGSSGYFNQAHHSFMLYPRKFHLNPEFAYYGGLPIGQWSSSSPAVGNAEWEKYSKGILWARTIPIARAWIQTFENPLTATLTTTPMSVNNFPEPSVYPLYPQFPAPSNTHKPGLVSSTMAPETPMSGVLQAIVKRGAITFYLWKP